jgi:hypothetical protein
MAQQPTNPKLWQMIIAQARARFAKYPSPGASHWVHDQYIKHGGKFIDTVEQNRREAAIEHFKERVAEQRAHHTDHKQPDKRKNSK